MAYPKSQVKASLKYAKNHLKRIPFDVQKEEYDVIKAYAEAHGETVNGMIKRLLRQEIGDEMPEEKPKVAIKKESQNKT